MDRFGSLRDRRGDAITIGKNGPKLKPSTVDPDATPDGPPLLAFVLSPELVRLPARYTTIAETASVMQRAVFDRPVVDKTGLTGKYDSISSLRRTRASSAGWG